MPRSDCSAYKKKKKKTSGVTLAAKQIIIIAKEIYVCWGLGKSKIKIKPVKQNFSELTSCRILLVLANVKSCEKVACILSKRK